MNKVVIIADDLTGANATGVLLARKGYRTGTFLRLEALTREQYEDYEVISINTDSRAIPAAEAYQRVFNTAQTMAALGVSLFSKRIDSTLRGNLGAEIDAVLDVLEADTMAVVVAAFPNSGRVTIGDYLMVNSVPLEKTDAARDPKTPVNMSVVSRLVAQQSKHQVGHLGLGTVLQGAEAIQADLLQHYQAGNRIVVVDAATQDDLDAIARGVYQAGIKVVAVDPGPFTEALAQYFLPEPKRYPSQKVLMVVGSVTPLTRQQLKEVELHFDTFFAYADARALIDPQTVETEINRVTGALVEKINQHHVLGIRTIKEEGDILDLSGIASQQGITEDEVAQRIAAGLARIAGKVLEQSSGALGALYTSGGDVTVAVCKELDALGVQVKDEVLPLAAYGRLIGGAYHNTPIVTKGGLVGDQTAIGQCIEYLLTKVSTNVVEI